jgi:hypothetical protein
MFCSHLVIQGDEAFRAGLWVIQDVIDRASPVYVGSPEAGEPINKVIGARTVYAGELAQLAEPGYIALWEISCSDRSSNDESAFR